MYIAFYVSFFEFVSVRFFSSLLRTFSKSSFHMRSTNIECRETKGVPLEEMDEIFAKGRRPWQKHERVHRVDQLEEDIKAGKLKVSNRSFQISQNL